MSSSSLIAKTKQSEISWCFREKILIWLLLFSCFMWWLLVNADSSHGTVLSVLFKGVWWSATYLGNFVSSVTEDFKLGAHTFQHKCKKHSCMKQDGDDEEQRGKRWDISRVSALLLQQPGGILDELDKVDEKQLWRKPLPVYYE